MHPPKTLPKVDLDALELNTDIVGAVARLDQRRGPAFALPANRQHVHRAKADDKRSRRGIKSFIRPENARALLEHLPVGPDDRTHCLLRGDFVLCDIIPALIAERGRCPHLRISTLGLSIANADALACLVERGHVGALTLIVSHYFAQVDKATVFRAVDARLAGVARLVITRTHAKVICLPTACGDTFTLEGSANLRSSDNIEQMVITNDPDTFAFHGAWIDDLAA